MSMHKVEPDNDANYSPRVWQLLDAWVNQRPGMDPCNYDRAGWNSDRARIYRQLKDYRALSSALRWRIVTPQQWRDAFSGAFSGRLSLREKDGMPESLGYCTGQYWCTEFRAAACAVVSSILWTLARENLPKGTLMHNSETGETLERINGMRIGDYMRSQFRKEFGRGVAGRWLD